jgi:heterotetrameric sarcosine oxidase gamma subunit
MKQNPTALSALQQAGLGETEFRSPNLHLQEVQNACLMRIRSLQAESLAATLWAAGMEIPVSTNQSSGNEPRWMCLRPGDWLVLSETLSAGELQEKLRVVSSDGNAAAHGTIKDASDGLAVVRLSGAAAPWLLAKLSGLDFLGAVGSPQHCARTRMGQVAVVVSHYPVRPDAAEFAYDLMVDRSIARYLWDLLLLSAAHAEELLATAKKHNLNA